MHGRPARSLKISALIAVVVMCVAGCKTSTDAVSLATQLSTTSKALSSYYGALDTELQATDQLMILAEGLNGTAYGDDAKAQLHETMAAIEARKAMADTLGLVSDAFGNLSGSTAAADAASSVGSLETAVEGLNVLPGSLNSAEKNALSGAVQGVVKLIQEHKERQAAAKMADAASKLAALFASEQRLCDSINDQYAFLSGDLAKELVRNHQVDTSAFGPSLASSALAPYSLTAQLSDDVKGSLDKELPKEIDRESAALKSSHRAASAGMEESLKALESAIATLAADKPLATNGPAATLGAVNQWVSTVLGK